MTVLLEVTNLRTEFSARAGLVRAVDGVSLQISRGECLGVVGESGSGKSVTFSSIMGLVRPPGRVTQGTIFFDGRDLRGMSPEEMRGVRGRDIAMTMQDALTALNPALTIGEQLAEVLVAHDETLPTGRAARRVAIKDRCVEMLGLVGIPSPDSRLRQYPHEFSGGMRQRIMIAIALACRPKLLIADEPTTALDVTIQAQVLELISDIRARMGMAVALITHDLGVVAEHCDRVMVMYAGQVVEEGPTEDVIGHPRHPYTRGLLASIPRPAMRGQPLTPIKGQVPNLMGLAPQCRFHSRCPLAEPSCLVEVPMLSAGPGRRARCLRLEETV
ncbi:MAG: ABC transporter ATP-binding protein [Hoeflea sp.]|uniref:ABC transporter ATP-binding protein n=1 Tax=Hoeflea sp. TaxID=1940281 RepID=UPI001D67AB93|nr:ABC transporter ATP-binding protein [Hoeflea sp.]MBU4529008.1 ABC transporter ATP-binding protein [Alphaproteobacteria bacterium]MBU4543413.1 ABC transporter ATP-binding protein [Alphaproteobacteria bacterium]MBU4549038.1 ABC transporter ATP-binding protein [Alphaproteobacteria bacterium]MBV1725173.1 ABC transporter ATP-binding protein [Hoeflea sp.]MBV1785134.1 ABC transporter ATP-binding protein [Hoeflea sp.]